MMEITVCPSTLRNGFNTYSPKARRSFLGGKKVSHILPYESLSSGTALLENQGHLSLSGVQVKYGAVIDDGVFRLTTPEEQGTYILKPMLSSFENREYSPANEHLTMQIASQVFGIRTAENGLCFTKSGEPVYVTRRFDVLEDGRKLQLEDLASLGGISKDINGPNFKYDVLGYVDLAEIIKRYIPAWRIELIKYFDWILFNTAFSNGDAHVKNFSVLQTSQGDYKLSPAYDLINTQLHIPGDPIFALRKGLYPGWNPEFGVSGEDFLKFGKAIGLEEKIVREELDRFCADYGEIDRLVANSFLSDSLKQKYLDLYHGRLRYCLRSGRLFGKL